MNLAILMYLIDLFNTLDTVAGTLVLVTTACSIILTVPLLADNTPEKGDREYDLHQKLYKSLKLSIKIAIVSGLVFVVIPSKSTMYSMTGLVVGEKIMNSERGNEVLDKSYNILINNLDKALEDTIPEPSNKEESK
jgi:hypothetical protein